jgi:hypothetical protein
MADYYRVCRDGLELYRHGDEVVARNWLLDAQPNSVHWATEYEGYSIVPVVVIRGGVA